MRPGPFTIFYFADGFCRIGRFRYVKGAWILWRFTEHTVSDENPGQTWQHLLRDAGYRPTERLAIAGALADGVFYRCASVKMPPAAQREAMELELARQLPFAPEKRNMQFFDMPRDDGSGAVDVNCYVFPEQSLERLADALGCGRLRADNYLYPLLGARPDDPPFFDASLEEKFSFADGSWHPCPGSVAADAGRWQELFAKEFKLPETPDFDLLHAVPLLLAARLMVRGDLASRAPALRVLPDNLRPVRFRRQLIVFSLLLTALVLLQLWSCSRDWSKNYREMERRRTELAKLTRRTGQMQTKLRTSARSQKERAKLFNNSIGDTGIIEKWAMLSQALPSNVRVVSMRWSDSGVDLVLQCESDGSDLSEKLGKLPCWKIAQLQQRRGWNDAGSTITLKLAPRDEGAVQP